MAENNNPIELEGGLVVEQIEAQTPSYAASTRDHLPARMLSRNMSIWSMIKSAIGKDLTRLTVPINYNEPLSLVQRLAENMQMSHLIGEAIRCTDRAERLEYIGAFASSALSSIRISKPYNPLLCETYELERADLGFRFVAEQVSHHPPVSATIAPKMSFYGRSITIDPQACFTLRLTSLNETYTWKAVSCVVRNIILGNLFMALAGTLTVKQYVGDSETDMQFRLTYTDTKANDAELLVVGEILSGIVRIRSIYGNWMTYIASCSPDQFVFDDFRANFRLHCDSKTEDNCLLVNDSRLLWHKYKKPPRSFEFYDFTYFAMMLNERDRVDIGRLPRTDSRLRPDIRHMENGSFDTASSEKQRIEQKQRDAKHTQSSNSPMWFYAVKGSDEFGRVGQWQFNGKYWQRNFSGCRDIF
uniref:Oxysterol-binding protein n=1 Tax=Ditylenchus dipsaci TaxID=166011 RepID=A0A915EGJ5_9BILA